MDNLRKFLEADALRTQGEWRATENKKFGWMDVSHNKWCEKGETSTVVRVENYQEQQKENATFIAAASRIAPDIRQLLAAFEQVCDALEYAGFELEAVQERGAYTPEFVQTKLQDALTAAAPYRKGGV